MMDFLPVNMCRELYFIVHPRWMYITDERKTRTVKETEHARLVQTNDYHRWMNVDTGVYVENRMTAYGKTWKKF